MFFVNARIVGGVVYAGIKTLVRRRPRKKTLGLATPSSQAPGGPSAAGLTGRMIPDETTTSRHLTTASVSLGLSMSGALFSTPLSLASVPLTVYNALPIFERAWADLFREGRLKMAMVQCGRAHHLAALLPHALGPAGASLPQARLARLGTRFQRALGPPLWGQTPVRVGAGPRHRGGNTF